MKIENKKIHFPEHYLSPITYVPAHANGDINHKDCCLGLLHRYNQKIIFMINCKTRTVQSVNPKNIRWG